MSAQLIAIEAMWVEHMVIEMSATKLGSGNYLEPQRWETWVFSPSEVQLEQYGALNVEDMFDAFVTNGQIKEEERESITQTGFFVRSLMQREPCCVLRKFLRWLEDQTRDGSTVLLIGPDVGRLKELVRFAGIDAMALDTRALDVLCGESNDSPQEYGTLLRGMSTVAKITDMLSFVAKGKQADPSAAQAPLWQVLKQE